MNTAIDFSNINSVSTVDKFPILLLSIRYNIFLQKFTH